MTGSAIENYLFARTKIVLWPNRIKRIVHSTIARKKSVAGVKKIVFTVLIVLVPMHRRFSFFLYFIFSQIPVFVCSSCSQTYFMFVFTATKMVGEFKLSNVFFFSLFRKYFRKYRHLDHFLCDLHFRMFNFRFCWRKLKIKAYPIALMFCLINERIFKIRVHLR